MNCMTSANCNIGMVRSRQLLRKYPLHVFDFIFTGEVFTVAPLVNLWNIRVYAPIGTNARSPMTACCTHDQSSADCVTLGLPSLKCNYDAVATGERGASKPGRAVTCGWFQSWARVGVAQLTTIKPSRRFSCMLLL